MVASYSDARRMRGVRRARSGDYMSHGRDIIAGKVWAEVWIEEGRPGSGVYSYNGCVIPQWVINTLIHHSDHFGEKYLREKQRFSFVYAALDYGILPQELRRWAHSAMIPMHVVSDISKIITKYVNKQVKLNKFKERRDCISDVSRVRETQFEEPRFEDIDDEELAALDLAVAKLHAAKARDVLKRNLGSLDAGEGAYKRPRLA